MKSKALLIFAIVGLSVMGNITQAQNNFFVGLNTSKAFASNNNAILQAYNDVSNFEEPFDDLSWLYGLSLGVRKKFGPTALSLSWTNVQRKKEAFKEDPPGSLSKEDLRYSFNTYELSLETHIRAFSYGCSMGRRNASIKTRIGSSDKNRGIVGESHWVSRFFIALTNTGSDFNSISIRPYFEYAWSDSDISELNNLLLGSKPIVKDSYHMFGISVIFYNGRQ